MCQCIWVCCAFQYYVRFETFWVSINIKLIKLTVCKRGWQVGVNVDIPYQNFRLRIIVSYNYTRLRVDNLSVLSSRSKEILWRVIFMLNGQQQNETSLEAIYTTHVRCFMEREKTQRWHFIESGAHNYTLVLLPLYHTSIPLIFLHWPTEQR